MNRDRDRGRGSQEVSDRDAVPYARWRYCSINMVNSAEVS